MLSAYKPLPRAAVASTASVLLSFSLELAMSPPQDPSCRSAAAALAAGRAEEAFGLYQTCGAAAPSFAAFKGTAEADSILGHSEDAITNFRLALAIRPEDVEAAVGLAQTLMRLVRFEEATRVLERAVVVAPENLGARNLLALALFKLKEYDLAAIEAGEVLRRDPTNISAAFILGASDVRLRLFARAVPWLERVRQLTDAAPSAEIRTTLGKAYLGIHQDARALAEFRAAEKTDAHVPGLYSQIGAAYAELGDKDAARAAYEKALGDEPNDLAANFGLARLNWSNGHYDAAEGYLAKARQGAPDDPDIQLLSAELAIHAQDYARAKPLLENVVRAMPENLRAHALLSQVYFHLQQMGDAKREEGIAEALREAQEKLRENAVGTPIHK